MVTERRVKELLNISKNKNNKIEMNLLIFWTLLRNIVIRFSGSVIFFVVIPLAARRLEEVEFQFLSYILSFFILFAILFDFGSSIIGIKKIALNKDNSSFINQEISLNFFHRLIVYLISAIILDRIIYYNFNALYNIKLALTTTLFYAGFSLNSIWITQAVDSLNKQMIIDFILKFLFPFILIYYFGHNILVFIFTLGVCYFISSFVMWAKYLEKFNIKLIKSFYKDNFSYFFSKVLIAGYTSILPLFAFYVLSGNDFSFFTISEKLYRGLFSVYGPISQSLFPLFILLSHNNKELFKKNILNQLYFQLTLVIIFVIILIYFSNDILILYSKGKFDETSRLSLILMFLSYPFMVLGNILGLQFLVTQGYIKIMNKCFLAGTLLMVFFMVLRFFNIINLNLGYLILFSEIIVGFMILYNSYKKWH